MGWTPTGEKWRNYPLTKELYLYWNTQASLSMLESDALRDTSSGGVEEGKGSDTRDTIGMVATMRGIHKSPDPVGVNGRAGKRAKYRPARVLKTYARCL